MKIEKISDTQVKFILNEDDLADKDIKLEDLAVSSDKTKELFHDMLSQALEECGFAIDDAPLIVEALPVAFDSIMIIVTKLSEDDSKDSAEDAPAPIISKDLHRYKRNSIKVHKDKPCDNYNINIYSFGNLDAVIDVCLKLAPCSFNSSSLYKAYKKYFLVLQSEENIEDKYICILNEYGDKESSNILTKYHLIEHGETLIGEGAAAILAKSFAD
ncbi:MAG: adaptor protein MecA [Clostridiales bacterium]|nr:adaptor protein MecA [Clostridiales bacterium]